MLQKSLHDTMFCYAKVMALNVLVLAGIIVFFSATATAQDNEPFYVGSKKCKLCHSRQYKEWAKTKMASSFEYLMPRKYEEQKKKVGLDPAKDYTVDPNCLACHTTGYGHVGGYDPLTAQKDLQGVTCESCHGPGSNYMKVMMSNSKFKKKDVLDAGLMEMGEQVCTACHNSKSPYFKTYGFNFKIMVKMGIHKHFPLKYSH